VHNEPNTSDGIGVGLTDKEHVMWFEAQCTNREVTEMILASNKSVDATSTTTSSQESKMVDITASATENINYINNLYLHDNDTSEVKRRRCFKSHSPLGLLEPLLTAQGKVIHIARNPKDVAVSLWHHSCTKDFGYRGDFSHFLEVMFVHGLVESGSWWDFVIPYWLASRRTEDSLTVEKSVNPFTNVLTIWYEDMIDSPEENIQIIANFLDIDGVTPERVREIASLCSFDTMKSQQSAGGVVLKERTITGSSEIGSVETPSANQIRRGGVGGWRDYFSSEQGDRFDEMYTAEVSQKVTEFMDYLNSNNSADASGLIYDETMLSTLKSEFVSSVKWVL